MLASIVVIVIYLLSEAHSFVQSVESANQTQITEQGSFVCSLCSQICSTGSPVASNSSLSMLSTSPSPLPTTPTTTTTTEATTTPMVISSPAAQKQVANEVITPIVAPLQQQEQEKHVYNPKKRPIVVSNNRSTHFTNWPPPLPTGIPEEAPLTVLAVLSEAEEDAELFSDEMEYTVSSFSSADKRLLVSHFVNFSKFGGEEQAVEALKDIDSRLYIKIDTLLYEFMEAYQSLVPEARSFIDGVIAFFKPVVDAELNPTGSSGPSDKELEAQEMVLIKQYWAMPTSAKTQMKESFPAIAYAAEAEIDRVIEHHHEKPKELAENGSDGVENNNTSTAEGIKATESDPVAKEDDLDIRDILAMLGIVATSEDNNEKNTQEE